jgi:hypothetical protein
MGDRLEVGVAPPTARRIDCCGAKKSETLDVTTAVPLDTPLAATRSKEALIERAYLDPIISAPSAPINPGHFLNYRFPV